MKPWLHDWQAKLTCLVLAILVWLAVKAKQDPDFDGDDDDLHPERDAKPTLIQEKPPS